MYSDPIADFLTRLRNGGRARHVEVTLPTSKMKEAISAVLKKEGYINDYSVEDIEGKNSGYLTVVLKEFKGQPVITEIKRISKPSCREYVGVDSIERVKAGLGISILSTPKGVMSDRAARKERVGGEVICTVW